VLSVYHKPFAAGVLDHRDMGWSGPAGQLLRISAYHILCHDVRSCPTCWCL